MTKDEMLSAGELETTEVQDCGAWGTVHIQQFDLPTLVKSEEIKWPPNGDEQATLIIWAVVNQNGEPRFTEEDRPRLRRLKPSIFMPLMKAIRELNRLDRRVGEAEKNSAPSLVA